MSTADAFLRDICEHPDDEAPRLVYADWLDEHGEEARAEFIRVECELEHTEEYSPRWRQLSARQLALIRAHKKAWAAPFKGWTYSTRFRRGFVETVSISWRRFVERRAELFRLAPVRQARFTLLSTPELRVRPGAVEALAALPELARLRGLDFGGQYLGDAALQVLLQTADLRNVTTLSLRWCNLTTPGLAALAAAPALAGLTALDLSSNRVGDGQLAALLRGPVFRLESLDLSRNELTDAGVSTLAASPALGNLRCLTLGERLTDVGFRALVRSPHLRALSDLRAGWFATHPLTDGCLRALAQAPAPPRLARLDLEGSLVGDAGVAALARYRHLDALRHLSLAKAPTRLPHIDAARITDEGARLLASLPALGGLRWLDLANNALTDAGAQALLASPHLAGLGYLNLKGSRPSADTQRAFRKHYGPGVCTFGRR